MPENSTSARPNALPRHKLTALGVVGAMVVALPLVQVLRYQNAEIQAVLSERAGLDPVARAVAVQRGLLAHRDIAAQVLRGRKLLEPERLLRQGEVDDRLASLALALASGAWDRAMREASALRDDWSLLSQQVLTRSVVASESDQAHRLLVEQTLQVIDLVAVAAAPALGGPGVGELPATTVAQQLPQLAWRIATLAQGGTESTRPSADIDAAEAELARALGRVNSAAEGRQPQQVALAEASAMAGASADRLFQLLRAGPTAAQEARAAGALALQAQFHLFDLAQSARAETLAERAASVERRRNGLLGALAGLLLAAAALAWRIARDLRLRQLAMPAPSTPPSPSSERREASRLIQRLREGREECQGQDKPSVERKAEPQPTLPPEA
jgi:hypothetical protein